MESIRQEVFAYLDKYPNSSPKDLIKAFPDYSKNSLRAYRNQYLEIINSDIDNNIIKRKKIENLSLALAILKTYDLIPLFIYKTVYFLTKNAKREDYSVVDIALDCFNRLISGTYNMKEVSDFTVKIETELIKLIADMKQISNNQVNKEITKNNVKNSKQVINDLTTETIPFEKIQELFKLKIKIESQNRICQDLLQIIQNEVLLEYIVDLYVNAKHLRNRKDIYIVRDFHKIILENNKGFNIYFSELNLHYDSNFSNVERLIADFNDKIKIYEDRKPVIFLQTYIGNEYEIEEEY